MTTSLALASELRSHFGVGNYHISKDGEVNVKAVIPQTGRIGWMLYGYVEELRGEFDRLIQSPR